MKSALKNQFLARLYQYSSFIANRHPNCSTAVLNGQSGVTLIEYVVITAITAAIIILLFSNFATTIQTAWQTVEQLIAAPTP